MQAASLSMANNGQVINDRNYQKKKLFRTQLKVGLEISFFNYLISGFQSQMKFPRKGKIAVQVRIQFQSNVLINRNQLKTLGITI